jgi:hypothetical protein
MRKKIPNLLIVAGDGRNSGKTSMVCRIIGQFRENGIVAVKISPHFHEPSAGLLLIESGEGYNIFEESNLWSAKDSSRMMQSGAGKVFYCQSTETKLEEAFDKILQIIPAGTAIVCESPALVRHFEPGIFVLMSGSDRPAKEISDIRNFPHTRYSVEDLDRATSLPFDFIKGEWVYKKSAC